MNYSNSPASCRCDFFKESGKWYDTVSFEWLDYSAPLIHKEFVRSLKAVCENNYSGMTAVCLEPYHTNAHPLMIKNWNESEV